MHVFDLETVQNNSFGAWNSRYIWSTHFVNLLWIIIVAENRGLRTDVVTILNQCYYMRLIYLLKEGGVHLISLSVEVRICLTCLWVFVYVVRLPSLDEVWCVFVYVHDADVFNGYLLWYVDGNITVNCFIFIKYYYIIINYNRSYIDLSGDVYDSCMASSQDSAISQTSGLQLLQYTAQN